MSQQLSFGQYLLDAIKHDYLIIGLVSSNTQGKRKSKNLPFGVGKTTLAMWLSYAVHGKDWDRVFADMVYNPRDCMKLIEPGATRHPIGIFDDVQYTCPAEKSVPKAVVGLASHITVSRAEMAMLIMTAPNINRISAPLRRLISFEMIVAERGAYEIQQIKFYKNYRKPSEDIQKLEYLEEGAFPPLPPEVQQRYEEWRAKEKKKIWPYLMRNITSYIKLQEILEGEPGQRVELPLEVKSHSGSYSVNLPKEYGERFHHKTVKVVLE